VGSCLARCQLASPRTHPPMLPSQCPPVHHAGQDWTLPVSSQQPDQTSSSQQRFEVPSVGLPPPHVPSSQVPTLADRGALCGIKPTQPYLGRAVSCLQHRSQARLHGNPLAGALGSGAPGRRLLKWARHSLPFCSFPQVTAVPLQTGEEEEAVVFHHHYVPYPGPAPVLVWPVPARDRGPAAVRYLGTGSLAEDREV